MTSEVIAGKRPEDEFWKDVSSMADYFSPGIEALQTYLGVGSKEIMSKLGYVLGEKAAQMFSKSSVGEMLQELTRVWEKYQIGTLSITSTDPLTILISNCRICGQLPGTGQMYECAFHEGFFQGALSTKLGRHVELDQETNYEGDAGTWCRRLVAPIKI